MKQLLSAEEMVGKTVLKVIDNSEIIIVFTDDAFIVLESDSDTSYISFSNYFNMKLSWHNAHALLQMGIITQEEYDDFYSEMDSKEEQDRIANEIATLKKLQSKYPEI